MVYHITRKSQSARIQNAATIALSIASFDREIADLSRCRSSDGEDPVRIAGVAVALNRDVLACCRDRDVLTDARQRTCERDGPAHLEIDRVAVVRLVHAPA